MMKEKPKGKKRGRKRKNRSRSGGRVVFKSHRPGDSKDNAASKRHHRQGEENRGLDHGLDLNFVCSDI